MNLQLLNDRRRVTFPDNTRRGSTPRFRPRCEGLEDRLVLSSAAQGHHVIDLIPVHAIKPVSQVHVLPTPPATATRGVGRVTPPAKHVVAPHVPAKTTKPTVPARPTAATSLSDPVLVTLDLKPLDVKLLGLEVKTGEIKVTVSAQPGSGLLLGNLLTDVANLLNLQGVSNALNSVLGSVVTLANNASLSVKGVNPTGSVPMPAAADTPVLNVHVAPVNLNLLGAIVTTSPIDLSIIAHSGPGLVLGNVVTDLANLLNGQPADAKLSLDTINADLQKLLGELNAQIPNINAPATTAPATTTTGTRQILSLAVPPIDLNLLGLVLQTDTIRVNADAQTGDGNLLGNLLNQVLNTLKATPQNLSTLNTNLNALLGKVVAVLNASTLTLPTNALNSLSATLQKLALPNLVNTTGSPASAPVLNLAIAAMPNDTTPPVDVNLLGLVVTTSNIHAQLTAQTGDGQVLGNLVYNVSHLLDPGGSLNLLTVLNELGV